MKFIITLLILTSTTTFAGPGHNHGHGHSHGHGHGHSHGDEGHSPEKAKSDIEMIKENCQGKIRALIFQEKIDSSWSEAVFESAEIKEHDNQKEWAVTFTNEKGIKGKRLYLYLSLSGELIAANFTGK